MTSGEPAAVCEGAAAVCAATGSRSAPARPTDRKATESGTRDSRPRRAVPGYEGGVRAFSIGLKMVVSLRPLGAVIGVPRQDGRGPVKLLQKHDTNDLVRPGRSPERDPEAFLAAQIGRKSVRAADDENSAGDRLVPPASKAIRETLTCHILTVLVERNRYGFLGDSAEIEAPPSAILSVPPRARLSAIPRIHLP